MLTHKLRKTLSIVILACVGLISLAAISLIPQVKFDYKFEKFLPPSDEDLQFYWEHIDRFESDNDFLLLGIDNTKGIFQLREIDKLESELRYLKAQTNPHFLFNTLNNIYALARKNSPNTSEAILHLSDILRFMLYECSSKRISIASEVKIIKDYIQLEKIRFNKKLRFLDQYEMDNPSQLVAPMILLPLVENAFKHGVGNSRFESEIDIKLKLDQGNLNFSIRNTFEIDQGNKEFEGIGIANVRRQLELIYPDKHSFEISRDDGIFSIKMKINLNRQNGQA